MSMIIAIDGPAGSGKGTIASILSKKLGLLNVDTGAMYRALTLACIRNNIDYNDENSVVNLFKNIDIKLTKDKHIFLNNEDVTDEIRKKEVTELVSTISSIIPVRKIMVAHQRNMANNNNVVMEGRDITTVVFPNATYKFYLDASLESRAKRRFLQNKEKNINMSMEEIIDNIRKRDYNDMNKKVGALKLADDAIYIDTTNMTIDEVTEKILSIIKE